MKKVNLLRLIFALASFGSVSACITLLLMVMGFPLGTNSETIEAVNFCFREWKFFGQDYDLLANCLDGTAANAALDASDDQNTSYEPPPESTPTLGAIEKQSVPNLDGEPEIHTTTCQPDGQLRIEFDFPVALAGEVRGEYVVVVNTELYQFDQSSSSGNRLVFMGPAPEESYTVIQMFLSGDLSYKGQGIGEEIFRMDSRDGDFSVEGCTNLEPHANPDGIPVIYNATCLQGKNLMVAFEFPEAVTGHYEAIIDGQIYQYTPVSDYPTRAYFFGPPPENQGPASVSLSTIPDGVVVFEQQNYEFPACGVQRSRENDNDSGGYVPPSY
jgi:hypothetical protein